MSNSSDKRRREEALIKRYGNPGALGARQRLRMFGKRAVWIGVVQGSYLLKRLFDILASAVLLVLLLPVFVGVALAIRLESPGAILFRQTRVGRWGKLFTMWKFRSMYADAEARKAALMAQNEMAGGVTFKMKNDPRVTRVGRFIRKTSIDELPQLWNVLLGDMSLVGPRPPVPAEVDEYSLSDRRRLEVIPGITCIWQISGRSEIPFDQQVELDVQYIESQSFWTDLKILLKTVPALLFGTGAY
jgi:exopolysaccharide biosynthesis polyprenyl glycosylphosphotransferase